MPGRSGVDDCYRNLSRIPVSNIAACLDLPDRKAVLDAGQLVTEPVGHKKWFFIGGFDDILQSVQLPVMKLDDFAGIGIDRTVCQLGELSGEGCCIGGSNFSARQLQDQLLLQIFVAVSLGFG